MKYSRFPGSPARNPERGVALAVVMVVMVVLTMFGVMILMQTDTNMIIGRYERETSQCRTAAEATTRFGINDAMTQFRPTGGFTSILNCTGNPNCPPTSTTSAKEFLKSQYILDYPGNPYNATWTNRLFSGGGPGDANSIYVTVYARNNFSDTNAVADTDNQVVVVGEAMMTESGAAPTANRSNVRVRKLIAAEIRPPRTATGGGRAPSGGNTGTGYGG